ncbi:large-conductance mechanosensitive channel protein MscL [Lewinella sp. JB7]|uniref:large-conductance mechanosensitive channel protein MscL n=1 Tax=Lewinella sp. JB7 TaxID=2962887 RepID=UPI0020C9CAE9|nr:large-conductance mechanosensitive channel protein MscL [Lewinella sp. JB7]MCP9234369.1 large-conductance mechanosensitive channel protein MscL [Lewinella sp. JB7]
MAGFLQEFKKFAVKGNMIDLAVGVVIGAAFNKIVDVLVKQIITPPLGYLTTGIELADLAWVLKEPVQNEAGEVTDPGVVIGYGLFLEAAIDFLIIAFTLFVIIRFINSLRDKAEDAGDKTVPTPKDIQLLTDIREEMKKLNGSANPTSTPPPA